MAELVHSGHRVAGVAGIREFVESLLVNTLTLIF